MDFQLLYFVQEKCCVVYSRPLSDLFCLFYTGMTHSQQRESLSLFEGAPSIVSHNSRHTSYHNSHNSSSTSNGGDIYEGADGLAVDDSLLILDRLREVTQKAVQLEV